MKAILTYHSIDDSNSVISIDPAVFRHQVEWLATNGPPVMSIEALLNAPPDQNAVAITFDDAFENFATHAWPVLRDHGCPVTVFVPTGWVGRTNGWDERNTSLPQLPILDWAALAKLAQEGVTLGSHTCQHVRLGRASVEQVKSELADSAAEIETSIGYRAHGIAYPYGSVRADVIAAAGDVYEYGCTTEMRGLRNLENKHALPRLDAYYLRAPRTIEWWGTSRMRVYLSTRAGARRCRQLLAGGGE